MQCTHVLPRARIGFSKQHIQRGNEDRTYIPLKVLVNVHIVQINVKDLTMWGIYFLKERAPGHLKLSRSILGLHTCARATDPKITREREREKEKEASLLVKLDLVHAPDGSAI